MPHITRTDSGPGVFDYPRVIYSLFSSRQWSVYGSTRDAVVFTSTVIKFILVLILWVWPAANVTVRTTTLAARKTDKLLFFSSLTHTHTLDWPWIIRLVRSGLFLCLISPTVTVRSVNKLDMLPNRHLGLQISIRSRLLSFILYRTVITGCCTHAAASNQDTLFCHISVPLLGRISFLLFPHPSQRDSSKKIQVGVFRKWLVMWLQWSRSWLTAQPNV